LLAIYIVDNNMIILYFMIKYLQMKWEKEYSKYIHIKIYICTIKKTNFQIISIYNLTKYFIEIFSNAKIKLLNL
jgi:hypothetical protein